MNRQEATSFVKTILKNGVDQNLKVNVVKKSILDYAKYLNANEMASREDIEYIVGLSNITSRLLKLFKTSSDFDMVFDTLTEVKPKKKTSSNNRPSSVISRFLEDYDCGSSRSSSHDSCGTSIVDHRSSSSAAYTYTSSSCDSPRSGGRNC